MKIAVLADIHGNLPALQAVLADAEKYQPDGYIVAGDFIAGPSPNEAISILSSLNGWMISGNTDLHVLNFDSGNSPKSHETSLQWAVMRWNHRNLLPAHLGFLRSLPEQRVVRIPGTAAIRVVHGSHRSPFESIFPDQYPGVLADALDETEEPVFICGHTHRQWFIEQNRRLALNPGSVCNPLDGSVSAQYAMLEWKNNRWIAQLQQVVYNLARIHADFYESKLLEEGGALARAFLNSIETGTDVALEFLMFAYNIADAEGCQDCEVIPDDIWLKAEREFNWDS